MQTLVRQLLTAAHPFGEAIIKFNVLIALVSCLLEKMYLYMTCQSDCEEFYMVGSLLSAAAADSAAAGET
jgi:hypothetical protein